MAVTLGAELLAACRQLAQSCTDAGVKATLERARVNPPGAWIAPQTVDLTTLGGDGTARVNVVLVAGDTGDESSHTVLTGLLDRLLSQLVVIPAEPIDTSWALVLPHTQTPLPAYRIPVDLDL